MTHPRTTDFERAGLLGGVAGAEREARAALLAELSESGVSLDELRRAVAEDRLVLLPVERVFTRSAKYTIAEVAGATGLDEQAVLRNWYGRPVNLASRVTSIARPGSVLVTEELRQAAGAGFEWSAARTRKLKGIDERVALYRATRA
jgi:hypothetical protein